MFDTLLKFNRQCTLTILKSERSVLIGKHPFFSHVPFSYACFMHMHFRKKFMSVFNKIISVCTYRFQWLFLPHMGNILITVKSKIFSNKN